MVSVKLDFPGGTSVKKKKIKANCQCRRPRRCGLDPWVRKIPWRGKMATHSSILAWEIQWTKEPARLQFKGSQRVDLELLKHNFRGF